MIHFLSNERRKWIAVILFTAIGVGITAKKVISYPSECLPESPVEISQEIRLRGETG